MRYGEMITSRQNPTVKYIDSLSQKKARKESGLFRFDGIKLFSEAAARGLEIEYAVLREAPSEAVSTAVLRAVDRGALDEKRILYVSESVFFKLSEEQAPEGIITVAKALKAKHRHLTKEEVQSYNTKEAVKILLAESLRDPGNLGTVIRSSAALGIQRLIITSDCADIYSPKTVRAAMGGLFALDIDIVQPEELPTLIGALRADGRRIYAAALNDGAVGIGEAERGVRDAFVIGNEGHGLSERAIDACDGCVIIPMTEGSESLNAAAAAAICIWETVKK